MNNFKNQKHWNNPGMNLILNWFNLLGKTKEKVRTFKDFENGKYLYQLVGLFSKNSIIETDSVHYRYEIIKQRLKNKIESIEESIDIESAKNSDEFELAKILAIIIYHLYLDKNKLIVEAAYKLTIDQSRILKSLDKIIFSDYNNSRKLEFYTEFLTSSHKIIDQNDKQTDCIIILDDPPTVPEKLFNQERTNNEILYSKYKNSKLQVNKLELDNERLDSENTQFMKDIEEKSKQIQNLNSHLEKNNRINEFIEKENTTLKEKIKEFDLSNEKFLKEIQDLKSSLASKEQINSRLEKDKSNLEEKIKESDLSHEKSLKEIQDLKSMYENGVSNFEEKIKEFSLSGEKSFKEIQDLNNDLETKTQLIDKLETKISKIETENKENELKLNQEIEAYKILIRKNEIDLQKFCLSNENSSNEKKNLEKQIRNLNFNMEIKDGLINKLEAKLANVEIENQSNELNLKQEIENLKNLIVTEKANHIEKDLTIKQLKDHDLELQNTVKQYEFQKETEIQNLKNQIEKSESDFTKIFDIVNNRKSNENCQANPSAKGKKKRRVN